MSFNYELSEFITFRDRSVCERVRTIDRDELSDHENDDLDIEIIDEAGDFYFAFALDLVTRIKRALDRKESLVLILPVGPVPQFDIAARIINSMGLPMDHVHTFNMDEYADENGRTAPVSWEGSFQRAMYSNFFDRIDEDLRPPEGQIHFPTSDNIESYGSMIEDLGGADACYGGVGWCGHIAFWESHLGEGYEDNLEEYKSLGPKIVELHPMTVMQNALHSFSGDWSAVPPKAATIGPEQILGADHRSFWLDGYLGGGVSWQRFIARLVLHGPVTPLVPGSLLQTEESEVKILGGVAENCSVDMA